MPKIVDLTCHKIVNSRGEWAIETHLHLDNDIHGVQSIPNGASKGQNEAVYVPVPKAVDIVTSALSEALYGVDVYDQEKIDKTLLDIDGTPNKQNLGGNSILSVSLAAAKAAALSRKLPLYLYLAELYGNKNKLNSKTLPTPLFNILNGGKHAANNLSFQEFMVIPSRDVNFEKAYEMGVSVYDTLKHKLAKDGLSTSVGDEGGFAPTGFTVEAALSYIRDAANVNFKVGKDIFLGMDVAADSFRNQDSYEIKEQNLILSQEQLQEYYEVLLRKFEIIYLEDPFYETHHAAWKSFYNTNSSRLMIVADDLVVTNAKFLKIAIRDKLANAVIVKPNQVGSLTETFEFIKMAQDNKMSVIVSHRSGDTAEDTFIADLGVAVSADFMKSGAPARGERVVKYNRLLEIYYNLAEKEK